MPFIGTRFETLTSLLKRQVPGRPGSFRPTSLAARRECRAAGLQKRIACLYFNKYLSQYTTDPRIASRAGDAMNLRRCAVQRRTHRMRSAHAEGEIPAAVRRVDRRTDEGGPAMQPLRRADLADSMFGRPHRRGRGAFDCAGPCPGRVGAGAGLGSGRWSWCSSRNSMLYRYSEIPGSGGGSRAPHRSRPSHHSCSRFGSCGAITGGRWPPCACKRWNSR